MSTKQKKEAEERAAVELMLDEAVEKKVLKAITSIFEKMYLGSSSFLFAHRESNMPPKKRSPMASMYDDYDRAYFEVARAIFCGKDFVTAVEMAAKSAAERQVRIDTDPTEPLGGEVILEENGNAKII